MIDLPDSAIFAAALSERRIIMAMVIAGLAGLVRGFSGFGGAMIYMPLVAAVYEPRIAAVTILVVDFASTWPFAIPEMRRCNWREVVPISIAMAVGVPFGTWALIALDPIVLRWCISIVVLGLLPPLVFGWRYHAQPSLPVTIGVGLFSGVSAGAVQIAGPPVILYWLSRVGSSVTVRANIMVFFLICGVVLVAFYAYEGLFTGQTSRCRCCWAFSIWAASALAHISSTGHRTRLTGVSLTSSSLSRRCSACRCSIRYSDEEQKPAGRLLHATAEPADIAVQPPDVRYWE